MSYFSFLRFFSLEPGDVIITGTPPGAGFSRKPPIYLKVIFLYCLLQVKMFYFVMTIMTKIIEQTSYVKVLSY